jgi:hypothetical protein
VFLILWLILFLKFASDFLFQLVRNTSAFGCWWWYVGWSGGSVPAAYRSRS